MELEEKLKMARLATGKTQAEVARAVGISQPAYQALETGRNKKTSFLPQIAKVLDVEIEWLLKNDLTTGSRVKAERIKINMSQADLAKRSGVTQGTISGLENGRNETSKELPAIAAALGKSVEFLMYGDESAAIAPRPVFFPRATPVPVIEFNQAHNWESKIKEQNTEYVYSPTSDISSKSFSVRVAGRSMYPEYKEGDLIIIDSAILPRPGDCVVGITSKNETVFKKYRPRGLNSDGVEFFELVPLNSDYPTLQSDREELKIIGTVVEHIRKLR